MPDSSFLDDINEFVGEYCTNYPPSKPKEGGKVVHDALWGTQHLQSHEVAVLDIPLLQRLRQIRQTAFTFLVFPSATHTRFEHTLGVVFQAQKLLSALCQNRRYKELLNGRGNLIRMAAVLHDCGHGPMSHSSEEIYRFLPDMDKLIGQDGEHEACNPHEVLSYYIVKSPRFREYFNEVMGHYRLAIDLDDVANIILGNWQDPMTKYVVDTINGPFDADKLDYLFRDGHFSGIPLKIDLDRLWYSLQIEEVPRGSKKVRMLVMSVNGVTPLEQILFSKMVLFASVYQHHKVRTCDCMMKAIYQYCVDNDETLCGRHLRKATDFLWLTDDTLFSEAGRRKKEDPLHKLIHNLLYRRLLKRALIISKATVEESSREFFGYSQFKTFSTELKRKDPELRGLADKIWKTAEKPCDPLEIWVDLPKLPPIGTADDTFVNVGTYDCPDFVKLKEIFRVDDWAQDYAEHKWRGHVFCPDDPKIRKKICDAATEVLEAEFSVKFNKASKTICNIQP